jgi:hypothetical protein
MVAVLVDLYGVLSFADVTVRIERAYASQLKGRLRDHVDRFLAATGLGLSLGAYASRSTSSSSGRPTRCRRYTRCSTSRSASAETTADGR